MDKWFHPTLYNECNYLSMLALKLIHISKGGYCPGCPMLFDCWWCGHVSDAIIYHWYLWCWSPLKPRHLFRAGPLPCQSDHRVNTLRPRQDGRHFADNIVKCIFLNEGIWISINISLKFVLNGQINNIPALVLIMTWRRPGDKPLSEPMMVSLQICVTRPQWVKISSG